MTDNLPDVSTPLILADGRVVDPVTGAVRKPPSDEDHAIDAMLEVPRNEDLKLRTAAMERRLADLPLPVERMHGLSVILSYSLFGLNEEDIAVATGLRIEQVVQVMMSDAYVTLKRAVVENIQTADMSDIRAAIHMNARRGLVVADEILRDGSEGAKVAILKDMLDRDGHRPVDVVEHRMKMEGGLRVEIVRKNENVDVDVNIDLEKALDTREIIDV